MPVCRFSFNSWGPVYFSVLCCEEASLNLSLNLESSERFVLPVYTCCFFVEGSHVFNKKERDRGFSQFTDRRRDDIADPKKGFLKDDTITIDVHIHLCRDWIEHADTDDNEDSSRSPMYDSKKNTGFIGMKNQGATCYLNSLIQSLYHLPTLRKAVFMIPTESDKSPADSIPLALQRLFYQLQNSNEPVGTSEVTRSFGWTTDDALQQHDIQEFCRKLIEKLELKMKATQAEGTIERLFRGSLYNFIKCTDVDYESSRNEDFYGMSPNFLGSLVPPLTSVCVSPDISLNVKGCRDVYESLRKYTEVETLDGENKYNSEKFGLQPAKKGILFESFPPILHLHLKRFEYDFEHDKYVKVYDKFFFPATINVKEFLSPSADKTIDYTYHLHGVFVHTGSVGAGHYYAFLRPTLGPQWYRFDDGTVSKVSAQKAIDDNFGTVGFDKKSGSAYMLVYAMDGARKNVFAPLSDKDIPQHLENRFNEDKIKEQNRLNAQREDELYTEIHVVTLDMFKEHAETDLFHPGQPKVLRLKKETPAGDVPKEVAKFLEVPLEQFRLWKWCKRKNGTLRLEDPLSVDDDNRKILSQLLRGKDKVLVLWAEMSSKPDVPSFIPYDPKQNCVISIKSYDASRGDCRFIGNILCTEKEKLSDCLPRIRAVLGWADDAPVHLYEEVRPTMVDRIDSLDHTLEALELGQGDILVAQAPPKEGDASAFEFPTPTEYFDWLLNRIKIVLKKKDDPKDQGISVWVDGAVTYSTGVKRVGAALNWEPSKIRLTPTLMYDLASSFFRSFLFRWHDERLREESRWPASRILNRDI